MLNICKIGFALLVLFSSLTLGQLDGFKFTDIPKDSLLNIAKEIIETDMTCTFITVDENNKPQARILANFPIEDDWIVWMGTFPHSRKVSQVKNNSNVMVFFYDPKGRSYVSIAGIAEIINNPEFMKKYWKDSWKKYQKNTETDYVLIKTTPKRLEICSYKHKLCWDETGKPAFIEFQSI